MDSEFMTIKFLKISIKNTLLLLLSFGLFSCSGGGGGGGASTPPAQKTGVFLDTAVSGAPFSTTSGLSGTTNTSGEFQYLPGDAVIFSIGHIELPSVPGADFITPLQMGVTHHIDDQTVINILRFLQSVDSDGNANNEITIPAPDAFASSGGNAVDFGQNDSEFEAALTAFLSTLPGNLMPVSMDDAKSHFESSLFQHMAGTYNGTFSGDAIGTLRLDIDASGKITGTATRARLGQKDAEVIQLSGNVQSDGSAVMNELEGIGSFVGTVTLSGDISGTWSSSAPSESGTFTGRKEFLADGFNAATLPGTYDFVEEGTGLTHVYTFNEIGNSFIDFGDSRGNRSFDWTVDPKGVLILDISGQPARTADRITLTGGSTSNGQIFLESDNDEDGVLETFVSGSFTKRPGA